MSALEALQATTMLLSEAPPGESVDTIFFHARAWGDEDGLFPLAAEIFHAKNAATISINGGKGGPAGNTIIGEDWPGCSAYAAMLRILGVKSIRFTRPAIHSKEENNAFLELAIEQQWRSGIILGQPHQVLRALMGMIVSMYDHTYWMRVYAVAPKNTDWQKLVYAPHTSILIPRFERIKDELDRIPIYQAKGHLCSYDELFVYLEERSTIV